MDDMWPPEHLLGGSDPCEQARRELADLQAQAWPYFEAHTLAQGEAARPDVVPPELQQRIAAAEARLADCQSQHPANHHTETES